MSRFAFRSASVTRSRDDSVVEIRDARELELDDLHGHLARDFARRVAAHAVGDDEQPAIAVRFDGEVVFVPGPDHAHIRAGGVEQTHH